MFKHFYDDQQSFNSQLCVKQILQSCVFRLTTAKDELLQHDANIILTFILQFTAFRKKNTRSRLTEEKLWAPHGSPLYLQDRSMSSSWWLSLSINSRLVPSKFLGGRKSLKSDSFLNQVRRSSWSKSKTMGLAVRLASSRPSQWPAKYRSLLVSL